MKFTGPLNPITQAQIEVCDRRLTDPARLEALARTGLMNSPPEEAFDRLARMAAQILKVPLTIISLVGDDKQFFKGGYGLPPPYDTLREVPIESSICRYTLAGQDIIAGDTDHDNLLMNHPTTKPWGIRAFMALPIKNTNGQVLGAFCAVDTDVHAWSDYEVQIMRELTASVMTEIELRLQVQDLAIERHLREQFIATLTHDLRNPIGVAKSCAEILAADAPQGEERGKLIGMISDNMIRADRMIGDLLSVTSFKAGEPMHLDLADCDLESILRTTLESLTEVYGERIQWRSCGPVHGTWDALGVRRIVENLVSNAIKYGAKSAPVLVSTSTDAKSITISVHNEGEPIAANEIDKIFGLFMRSDAVKKGAQKGWGIGLALVRGFAEAHGGSVKVDSSPERGTTFKVELPIHPETR